MIGLRSPKMENPPNRFCHLSSPMCLIVMKGTIKGSESNQAATKRRGRGSAEDCSLDPRDVLAGDSKVVIGLKDVLGCIEVKRKTKYTKATGSGSSQQRQDSSELSSRMGVFSTDHTRTDLWKDSLNRRSSASGLQASSNTPKVHLGQLGNYASEFLSRGPYVTHNIGFKIDRAFVSILTSHQYMT